MNDIDRSVDSMDFALRRRFQWIEVKANEIMKSSLHSILGKNNDVNEDKRIDDLTEKIQSMNTIISSRFGLSEAYHIGPAYFKNLNISSDDNLRDSLRLTFDTNVVSILKEYTRGRKSEEVNTWIEKCRKSLLGDN
jgi:tRNA A37 methylthiotransferase MiaB